MHLFWLQVDLLVRKFICILPQVNRCFTQFESCCLLWLWNQGSIINANLHPDSWVYVHWFCIWYWWKCSDKEYSTHDFNQALSWTLEWSVISFSLSLHWVELSVLQRAFEYIVNCLDEIKGMPHCQFGGNCSWKDMDSCHEGNPLYWLLGAKQKSQDLREINLISWHATATKT